MNLIKKLGKSAGFCQIRTKSTQLKDQSSQIKAWAKARTAFKTVLFLVFSKNINFILVPHHRQAIDLIHVVDNQSIIDQTSHI